MLGVSFFTVNSKSNKHGKVPINAKIYRSEQDKATLYTKVQVLPSDWDGYAVLPTDPLSEQYNAILQKLKADLLKQYVIYPEASASEIKERYIGSFKVRFAMGDLFKGYIKEKVAEKTNPETIRTYLTHERAMVKYLKGAQLYSHDASSFAYQQGRVLYQRILKDAKSTIYANKLMWKLKSALEWGVGERLVELNSLQGFKLKTVEKKRLTSLDYLNLEEITKLVSVDAPKKYDTAKILATRQLFTGMAFSDAIAFTPDMVGDWNGKKILKGNRTKTGEEYIVPLDVVAEAVCTGNGWQTRPIKNCTYNHYLKVLAAMAGIKKNVTTHMLRRSFAQAMRDSGISDPVIAKMLGHKDTRMLVYYSTISEYRVAHETGRLAA